MFSRFSVYVVSFRSYLGVMLTTVPGSTSSYEKLFIFLFIVLFLNQCFQVGMYPAQRHLPED